MTSRLRFGRWLLAALGGVLCILPLHYAAVGRETTTVEAARSARALQAGEGYIPLRAGITHYRLDGPDAGPVVVLVHGFMDTLRDWDAVVPGLTAAGFRVLRYDLYGMGLSARPPVPHTRELLRDQLLDLLDRLHVERVRLAGHSLGGAIAVDFTAHHPPRVLRLAVFAPAVHIDLARVRIVRIPVVGRYVARTKFLPDVARRLGVRASSGQAWAGAAIEHLQYKGTEDGFLSIITGDGFSNYLPECAQVGRLGGAGVSPGGAGVSPGGAGVSPAGGLPVLLAWGSADALVDRRAMSDARAAMPGAEWHELAGAPHELPMDRAPQVTALLLSFFLPKR